MLTSLGFMRGGRSLVSGSLDGVLRVWDDLGEGVEPCEIKGHAAASWTLVVLRSGDVVTGSEDKTIRLWSVAASAAAAGAGPTGAGKESPLCQLPALTISTAGAMCSIAELAHGNLAAGLVGLGEIEIWEISAAQQCKLLTTVATQGWSVWSLCVLPSGLLVSEDGDGNVCTWDARELTVPRRVSASRGHGSAVHWVGTLSDGRLLSAGYDGRLCVW